MRAEWGRRLGVVAATGVLAAASLLCVVGCSGPAPAPSTPTVTPTFPADALTVVTTDRIGETDPAGVTDSSSTLLSANVFQTLMTADPGADVLKPNAARDCIFDTPMIYTCVLSEKLAFHNGDPVTSADVKFSIERATRLDVTGSSVSLLSSLRRIETPDPQTVRFVLSRPDTQFGWALAAPAAALVDRKVYDPDRLQPADKPIVGSGPFRVVRKTDRELDLLKFRQYIGRNVPRAPAIAVKTLPDSASVEDAMADKEADVVWRGLSTAALARFGQQIAQHDGVTNDGYTQHLLPGARVRQLLWYPRSNRRRNNALRQAVEVALQDDRTLDSVVPVGVPGHSPSFAVGGVVAPKVSWKDRITLTLGYDSTIPDGRDLAIQIRSRLEDTGGLSVRLVPDDERTDLQLEDRKAWTATAIAWLQPYLDAPLSSSRTTVSRLDTEFRAIFPQSAAETRQADALLAALQSQAASDATVLPVTQSDEVMFVGSGVSVGGASFGPDWQLGLWGMGRG